MFKNYIIMKNYLIFSFFLILIFSCNHKRQSNSNSQIIESSISSDTDQSNKLSDDTTYIYWETDSNIYFFDTIIFGKSLSIKT